jgi:ribosomal protein S12 methylthiotransferase
LKINLISLGCPKNLVDSEKILGALGAAGMTISPIPEESDAIIINTCGFIAPAIEETEQVIKDIVKLAGKRRRVFVIGCAVNRYGVELQEAFPQVSGWFRLEDEWRITAEINAGAAVVQARLPTTRGYAYLKIADGCSNDCAYCTIPSIKGPYHSFDLNELVREGRELAALGIKELILIGQDTTRYGNDLYGKTMLRSLIRELSSIRGIEWLRLMYAHPKTIDTGIIEEIAENSKVCKYIDLPIQHINDRILRLMNRGTGQRRILEILRQLKGIDDMVIRTTIIVGFPTESDDEFNELMDFLQHGYIDWLGVFPYYQESGTAAENLDPLPEDIITERYQRALALQQQLLQEKNSRHLNHEYKVLVHAREKEYVGHAEFTAPDIDSQVVIAEEHLEIGAFYNIKITAAAGHDLRGKLTSAMIGVS